MKLGATLYIKNTIEAVALYIEAFGLTLGSRPTMSYGINFESEEEVKRAYELLAEAGTVLLELGTLPWSTCCADIIDKYGVYWYLSV